MVHCYGSSADECVNRFICAKYVAPPQLEFPYRDYKEHWSEEEVLSGICNDLEVLA